MNIARELQKRGAFSTIIARGDDMAQDWITTAEAARLAGYHVEHIRGLARRGAIKAQKWARDWQISKSSLLAYIRKVGKLGKKRGPKVADT
jgi:excisionase family DNA binding protein